MEPQRASRGAELGSELESVLSQVKSHPQNPRSTPPSSTPSVDLDRSTPITPSQANCLVSRLGNRRRNRRSTPAPFRRTGIRRSQMRGAKLASESDTSPEKARRGNPRPEAPPSQRPDLGRPAAPPPPPAADKRPEVENELGRRLPKWCYRCLPDYFYMQDVSAIGDLIRARAEEARLKKEAAAQIADADKPQLEELEDDEEAENWDWEDEVPWCGGRTGSA